MKRTGVDLLKTRSVNDKIDVSAFESAHGVCLPPFYKKFIETFVINDDCIIGEYVAAFDTLFTLYTVDYELDSEIILYNFFSLDEVMPVMKNNFTPDDEIWNMKLLPIGECAFQLLLMVGIGEHNQDKIYLEGNDQETRIRLIHNDIFEFVQGLESEQIPPSELKIYTGKTDRFDQLYRNWNESFWRVRGENKQNKNTK